MKGRTRDFPSPTTSSYHNSHFTVLVPQIPNTSSFIQSLIFLEPYFIYFFSNQHSIVTYFMIPKKVSIAINLEQSILCFDNYYNLLFDLWTFLIPIHHCQTNLSRISLSWCYCHAQKSLMTAICHLLKRFKFLSFVPTALSD